MVQDMGACGDALEKEGGRGRGRGTRGEEKGVSSGRVGERERGRERDEDKNG